MSEDRPYTSTRVGRKRDLDQDVYTLAKQRTRQVLADFDRAIVAFSGGKDSTAVLQVTLDVIHDDPRLRRHLPLPVVFCDEEAIPIETEQYVRRVGQRDDIDLTWLCLPVQHRNACSRKHPYWWPWAPESRHLWCRPLPPEAVTEYPGFPVWPADSRPTLPDINGLFCPPEHGTWAMLMGIRAQESMTRRRAVSMRGREHNYLVKPGPSAYDHGNMWKAYPIYDWSTTDVWTAPAQFGWDYNRAYDRMEMVGIPHLDQRCCPAFGEEPIRGLWQYAQCFPEVWEKMVDRVPGVGAAVRYARTELYGFKTVPEKPPGITWLDMVKHYIDQHPPNIRQGVGTRIRNEIIGHYRKKTHPILPATPHPDTGIDWTFLTAVAIRGDFKKRRQAKYRVPVETKTLARCWRRYADELATILAAGRFAELGHPGPPPRDPHQLIPAEYRRLR